MSIVHQPRLMVCDVCGWELPEPEWEFHRSLRYAVEANAWHHDENLSLCELHAAETLKARDAATEAQWPSAVEVADWCHPAHASIVSRKAALL